MFSYLEIPMSVIIQVNNLAFVTSLIHQSIEANNNGDIRTTLAWILCQTDLKNLIPSWRLNETDFTISAWNKMGMHSNSDCEEGISPCRIMLSPETSYNNNANMFSIENEDTTIDVCLGLDQHTMEELEKN